MSELREEILGAGINKKRIIGVSLVAILLIAIFAFSVTAFSFLFGSQRPAPSREKAETEHEDALLIKPPFPFDADWLQSLLDQFDLSDLANLNIDNQTLINMLSDLLDGDLGDLDLGNFSMGSILPLLALLGVAGAGEIEIFRVYNYDSLDDMRDVLWKFECFDEYTGDGWHSTVGTDIYDFYAYEDYFSKYAPDPPLLKIKKPVPTPEVGINSMVIPTLFPNPYVMDGSINVPNIDTQSTTLYKNEFNCTKLDLFFTSSEGVNMTYEMFGEHLPTDQEINSNAVEAVYTPTYIKNKYLQLPPTIDIYKSNNPYFNSHFNNLDAIINPSDNAFVVANKIKNYLNTYFDIPRSVDEYNPAPEGVDTVEWFCQTRKGVYSDFASAFCAFSRAFGVASRFVDGFNTLQVNEFLDNNEGQNTFVIKYKNLYNWAEVFVPMDISGSGKWVQFDIEPITILGGDYNITVTSDRFPIPDYYRPDTATITATVSSPTDPVDGLTITFTDTTTGQNLGQSITDINGEASILFDLNNSHVVGPHIIEAKYDDANSNYTIINILGEISVLLTNLNPAEINISDSQLDSTNIQGYVYDPINGERVKDAVVNLLLFQRDTNIEEINAFSPPAVLTNGNGDFNEIIDLNPSVLAGQYEIRADFNGTWIIYSNLHTIPSISDSSNRMGLNVTKSLDILFYINGIPADNPTSPQVIRYTTLTLTARAVSVVHGPMSNKRVYFHDYSRGDVLINSDLTDINGYASVSYYVGDFCVAGPNLLYARLGLQKNYSYFILEDTPTINIISGPNPRVINRTGSGVTQFNIVGEIYDSTNNSLPISYSEITLTLLKKSGENYSSYLAPSESYPYQTGASGYFDLTFGVAPDTPPGNYTLRLDFNGTINFDFPSHPYPYLFNLPILTTTAYFTNDLRIEAEVSLLFWINGISSEDVNNPQITRNQDLTLTTYIHQAGTPIENNEWVYFYDVTQDGLLIGADQTLGGSASVIYDINDTTTAGPHLIYATWNNRYNYSYFILDAPINVSLDICPSPREINRTGTIDRNFIIHGYMIDGLNGNPVKYGEIYVNMYDGFTPVTSYLQWVSGSLQLNASGEINLIYSVTEDTPAKNYTLEVAFNGVFIHTDPNYPNYFDLNYIINFSYSVTGLYDLLVNDPDNIYIFFLIDGNPTLPFYDDFNLPQRYNEGDPITFTVIIQQGGANGTGLVTLTDVYTGTPIASHNYVSGDNGYHDFNLFTTGWHAGLHQIKVEWGSYEAFNKTYIIINEFVRFDININPLTIQRDVDNFIVSGTVHESGVDLRNLVVNLRILDDTKTLISLFNLIGSRTDITDANGNFQFNLLVNISCLQGIYYIRIDFNGSIFGLGIDLSNYMVHNSSVLVPITITAGTNIIQDSWWTDYDLLYPEYSDRWIVDDTLHVNGTLTWDNGSAISNMLINVTVKLLDGTVITFNDTVRTDINGYFEVSIFIDISDNWPEFRNQSEIWVYFDPSVDGIPYVEGSQQEYT